MKADLKAQEQMHAGAGARAGGQLPTTRHSLLTTNHSLLTTNHYTMSHKEIHPMNTPIASFEQDYLAWYTRKNDRVGTAFDPTALVRLAAEQWPSMPKVAATFALCTAEWPRNELYTNFLCDADRAASRFAGGSILEDPNLGVLVVDFAYDPQVPGGVRVSGMEYLDRVLGHSGVDTIRRLREMQRAKSAQDRSAKQSKSTPRA